MSVVGMKEEEILAPMKWPSEPWSEHFDFVPAGQEPDTMSEAEGTLVAFLDLQQLERLRVDMTIELRGKGSGFSLKLLLQGTVIRRCALSGEFLSEQVDFKDQFDFVKPARSESRQKKIEAQVAEDLGTGLEEGPDIWDYDQPPTLIGLIADSLEDALDPFPVVEGAAVAHEFAEDPQEGALAEKMHPFAALKALKKDEL